MKKSFTVTATDTAKTVGSGTLEVLATPKVAAWFEGMATELASELTAEGESSVGTNINIDHLKKSKIGESISCEVRLVERDRRMLKFEAEAYNEQNELIAKAVHTRFIINITKFLG